MKYIPVFHPFGVALWSKSVPDGFVTKDFTKKWNNSVYSRLSKILCGFKDQVRARPSGEKCGLDPGLKAYRDDSYADGINLALKQLSVVVKQPMGFKSIVVEFVSLDEFQSSQC